MFLPVGWLSESLLLSSACNNYKANTTLQSIKAEIADFSNVVSFI